MTDWQNLSKRERRQLKKEQKRRERVREKRKKRLIKWGIVLGIFVLLAGIFLLFGYLNEKRYENAPKIQVTPQTYNFGKVPASEGKVEITFEVKNVGVVPLTISGMETSCGCTTAKLQIGDKESPEFGMHNNPTDWSTSLESDETAELLVVFDPNFHKDTFGSVTRTVSIFSNDPGRREGKVSIYADVER